MARPRSSFVRCSSVAVAIVLATVATAPVARAAQPASAPAPTSGPAEPAPTATAPTATAPAPAEHEALIAEGDALVSAGNHAEGATRLSNAYVQLPAELRVGEVGRHVVTVASNAYEAAWQATADAGQLEANQVLLRAYLADLATARAAGQPTTPVDATEEALRARSADIDRMLADVRAAAAPAPAPAPKLDPATIEPQVELTFPPPDPRLRRNALILVGVGAGGAVAGGIMVIAGAVTASRAEEQRQSMPDDASEARSTKVGGTILATTGALLFSGSVMMLGVGSNRLGDYRREVALTVGPTIGGMVLRGRF